MTALRHADAIPTLSTARLVLRPLTLDDCADVQHLAGAPEIAATTIRIPHPYVDGAAEAWICRHGAEWAERTALTFAIECAGELVGSVGLMLDMAQRHAELGYWIGMPYWGRGYATEASVEVVRFAFDELDLHRVHAHHFAVNPASGRVLEKLGMSREGVIREHIRKGEGAQEIWHDLVWWGVLESEIRDQGSEIREG